MSKEPKQPRTAQGAVTAALAAGDLSAIIKATNCEDPSPEARTALATLFERQPHVWQNIGDMATRTQERTVTALCGASYITREATARHVAHMGAEMGLEGAPALERALIGHIITCWLRLQYVEINYTGLMKEEHVSMERYAFWDRQLTQAQTRYLRAVETLARVRRLARPTPAVQVNVAAAGGQQLNQIVAAATEAPLLDGPQGTQGETDR